MSKYTFSNLQASVLASYETLKGMSSEMYLVDVADVELFNTYLEAFPEEHRQEHKCSCCRTFLRDIAGIVAIKDGEVKTLWDFQAFGEYVKVPKALRELVLRSKVSRRAVYPHTIQRIGTQKNIKLLPDKSTITFNHFFLDLAQHQKVSTSIDSANGIFNSLVETTARSLDTLSMEAVDIVLSLIRQNNIYRGQEMFAAVNNFKEGLEKYQRLASETEKHLFCVENYKKGYNIRNSSIGNLLENLSEGMALDIAVKKFETMVAPLNYKRSSALVTPKMVEAAKEKIQSLGLLSALSRRHAERDDLPVDKVLYTYRPVKEPVGDLDVFANLASSVPVNFKTFERVVEIPIDIFLKDVLPETEKLELLFESRLEGNLVNLLSVRDKEAGLLFPWDSPLSWSYKNNVTDSMKEKVKMAGGDVEGELRISLGWETRDDLDLAVNEPDNGDCIYYGNRSRSSALGGKLDVDANATTTVPDPVENIIYRDKDRMVSGIYKVRIHNYNKRVPEKSTFKVEIECRDKIYTFAYADGLLAQEYKNILIHYDKKLGITNIVANFPTVEDLPTSKNIWSIETNKFIPINVVTYSPNYWEEEGAGNKHIFFISPSARNPEATRGIYNEFLKPSLREHRKVLEVLGNSTMVAPDEQQMAGLGFSTTQKNYVYLRRTGSFTSIIKVIF